MADRDAILAKLQRLDKSQLQGMLVNSARELGKAQKQIEKKDALIADFTSQRERNKRQAAAIINDAKRKADAMKDDARRLQQEAEQRSADVEEEVSKKLANANAEADSIVETRLAQAQNDIRRLEERRDASKRSAIKLNKNIIDQYDKIITGVEDQISGFRDMQQKLRQFNADIESEDFKKFDVSDFVTITQKPDDDDFIDSKYGNAKATVNSALEHVSMGDLELNDDELSALSGILGNNGDDLDFSDALEADDDSSDNGEDEYDFDYDTDVVNDDFNFDDADDDDDDDDNDDDGNFSDKTMKSFTDSFMAVPGKSQDDDDDYFDDADDDDDSLDSLIDDSDDIPRTSSNTSKKQLNVPKRKHGRRNGGAPSQWL